MIPRNEIEFGVRRSFSEGKRGLGKGNRKTGIRNRGKILRNIKKYNTAIVAPCSVPRTLARRMQGSSGPSKIGSDIYRLTLRVEFFHLESSS